MSPLAPLPRPSGPSTPAARHRAARATHRRTPVVLALLVALVATFATVSTTSSPASAAVDRTLVATDSAWTSTRSPASAQTTRGLSVTNHEDRTYLKFDGSDLGGAAVESATLVLTVRSTTATQPGVVVHPTSTDWASGRLTQATQPDVTGDPVSEPSERPRAGRTLEIPLDVDAVSTTGEFALRLSYTQRYIRLMLERNGADAPRVVVTTATGDSGTPDPTTPPTTPAPEPTPEPGPATPPTPSPRPDDGPLVFAHYFTPYPLSLDNQPADVDYYARHYLSPDGENGKFAAVGGLLRDRPISPGRSSARDWTVQNFVTEIEQAKSAGIDGWTLDLLSSGGRNWTSALEIMDAADQAGDFVVVPMVDATAGFANSSPETIARQLSELYAHDSAYRENGEYMLSAFKAENRSVSWWRQLISALENRHDVPVTFLPLFLDASEANMRAFAPIADGFSNWGTRTEHGALNRPNYAARAAALDRTWMEPVAVQDIRYKDGRWAESLNTTAVRAQWERAIAQDADYVQLVTWNDYSESTQMAPSMAHGTAFLDITRYYASWYRSGEKPTIGSDEVVLTHRTQLVDARPRLAQTLMGLPLLGGSSTAPRDAAEALVWLTEPATVVVTVGDRTQRFDAPAGVSAWTVPLRNGEVSAQVVRDGRVVQSLRSPFRVVANPPVQDLQYHAASTW